MSIKNKRGLSEIVATLLIILLSLVAVGILWIVIKNVVDSGAKQIELNQKCLAVELTAVRINETSPGNYSVSLKRGADSQGDIGVKINIFQGTTTSSGIMNFEPFGNLDALGTSTKVIDTGTATLVVGGDGVEFTAFFQDDSGNEQLCPQTKTFKF